MLVKSVTVIVLVFAVAMYASADNLKEEEDTPAKQEYEGMLNEINQALSANEFGALKRAVKSFNPRAPQHSKYYYTPKAFSIGLRSIYKDAEPKGFSSKTRFTNLFEEYITVPCERVKKLKEKLDEVIGKHEQLNNYKFKYTYVPDGFSRMNHMCGDIYEETFRSTFREF